ncbi:MAG: DUF6093 family protein [Anaerolineae bacterium]|nr:DUF6093 family protein [Anaerolineae bacterium]
MLKLQGAVLAQMRAAAESLMTDTCTIEQLSDAVDRAGAPLNTWETVASNVRCRLITAGLLRGLRVVGEQPQLGQEYRVVLPAGTAIDVQHRITLDSDGTRWLVNGAVAGLTDEVSTQVYVMPEAP